MSETENKTVDCDICGTTMVMTVLSSDPEPALRPWAGATQFDCPACHQVHTFGPMGHSRTIIKFLWPQNMPAKMKLEQYLPAEVAERTWIAKAEHVAGRITGEELEVRLAALKTAEAEARANFTAQLKDERAARHQGSPFNRVNWKRYWDWYKAWRL